MLPQKPKSPALLGDYLPMAILTDSYKATHFLQYPPAKKMVAYGEFRTGFDNDKSDCRIVWYGIRYIIEHHVSKRWTIQEIDKVDAFYATHMAPGHGKFPYPRELFLRFIKEHNGYMPVKIEILPEGTCVHPHVPVFQITAEEPYAPLCTFLETLLVQAWYPSTVATLSRRIKTVLAEAFDVSVDQGRKSPLLHSRLHDFGFRGCTCVEQSVLGGVAHLLSFKGSDTMSAAYYAQFGLNEGRPVASSIPATEHSVMTSWPSEREAISNMIANFGNQVFATVMDSYSYKNALEQVVPSVAAEHVAAGGFWVLRPDSGVPEDAVVAALQAAESAFGAEINEKGYKIPRGVGVIQGDGISAERINMIIDAVHAAGYSIQSVAFGMGGGLLQKVHRDTMSFAVKLNHIVYAKDDVAVDVMKAPQDDPGKDSLPGRLAVRRVAGIPMVFPLEDVIREENMMQVVYDCGPVPEYKWESFDELRDRVEREWSSIPPTPFDGVISPTLAEKRKALGEKLRRKTDI